MNINIYGDSILKGIVYDKEQGKYIITHNRRVNELEKRYSLKINNRSRFGYTSRRAHELIDFDIKKGLNCDVAVIEYGGNDCNFNWQSVSDSPENEHLPIVTLDDFLNSVRELATRLLDNNVKVILTNLPPIDAEKYLDFIVRGGLSRENILKWLGDAQCIYRWQEMYSEALTELAHTLSIPLCNIRSGFLRSHSYKHLLCDDGIHPNINGQDLIIDAFEEFLKKNV